jgi:hypothetical protein
MKYLLITLVALGCAATMGGVAHARGTALDGRWLFVFDTPDGGRDVDAEFAVAADGKVTGKLGPADVAGTYKDGALKLDFPINEPQSGETGPLKIVGKMNDNELSGNWEFSSYSGTFKATRPKPGN